MGLLIRAEQMSAMQTIAEEKFTRRIAQHLLAQCTETMVQLPNEETTVAQLSEKGLHSLVRTGIKQARSYGLSFESTIAAYVVLMFEIAPNFDQHELINRFLNDEAIAPNDRLDPLLDQLDEKSWEIVKKTYDANAWQFAAEEQNGNSSSR